MRLDDKFFYISKLFKKWQELKKNVFLSGVKEGNDVSLNKFSNIFVLAKVLLFINIILVIVFHQILSFLTLV